jgi:hypothetical protein
MTRKEMVGGTEVSMDGESQRRGKDKLGKDIDCEIEKERERGREGERERGGG